MKPYNDENKALSQTKMKGLRKAIEEAEKWINDEGSKEPAGPSSATTTTATTTKPSSSSSAPSSSSSSSTTSQSARPPQQQQQQNKEEINVSSDASDVAVDSDDDD